METNYDPRLTREGSQDRLTHSQVNAAELYRFRAEDPTRANEKRLAGILALAVEAHAASLWVTYRRVPDLQHGPQNS